MNIELVEVSDIFKRHYEDINNLSDNTPPVMYNHGIITVIVSGTCRPEIQGLDEQSLSDDVRLIFSTSKNALIHITRKFHFLCETPEDAIELANTIVETTDTPTCYLDALNLVKKFPQFSEYS